MTDSNQVERNKMIYREFIQTIFNEGQLDKLHEFVSPEYVLHHAPSGTPSGSEAIRHVVSMFRKGFSDLKITLEEIIAEREFVSARSIFKGTHTGIVFGVAATGKSVTMPSLTMVRILGGKLCESWVRNDVMGLLQQLNSEATTRSNTITDHNSRQIEMSIR